MVSLPPFPYKQEEELIKSSPLDRSEKAPPPPPPQEDGLWIFVREDGEKLLPLGLEEMEMEMGLVDMKGEGEEGVEGVEGEFDGRPMSFLALRTTE